MSKIDYDLSKIKGIAFDVDGVLSPSTIPLNENGIPMRMGNVKDGYALQYAVKRGLKIAVITGGFSEAIAKRLDILGITDVWQSASYKLPIFREWVEKIGADMDEVVYVGDDIPDLECMKEAGLACCPADAAPEIRTVSGYISKVNGGYGVARDIIEQILKARNLWGDGLVW